MTKNTASLDESISSYSASTNSSRLKKNAKFLAFGAAAAGGLLASSQAEADIIYSGPLNINVPFGYGYGFDVDGDADADFAIFHLAPTFGGVTTGLGFAASPATGSGLLIGGTTGGFNFPFKGFTSAGSMAPGAGVAGVGWMGWASGGAVSTDPWGVFANASVNQTGIVGFSFSNTALGQLAGWFRVVIHAPGVVGPGTMTLVDFAYNDAGGPIHLGAIVPEPGTAGLAAVATLALGAAGLRRRRKSAQPA